ncbi:MAG: hypothetical protein D0528_01045 [Methylococcales bacterium]|nr:MAG: hypothetical protein D0528_01045 [Methylococcales bacterium]
MKVFKDDSFPLHWSDCAIHNEPAYPAGACDCGGAKAGTIWWRKIGRRAHMLAVSGKISLLRLLERSFQIHEKCASQECARTNCCLLLDKPVVLFGPFGRFHKCPAEQFVDGCDNKIEATACCGLHRKWSFNDPVNDDVETPNAKFSVAKLRWNVELGI